MDVFIYHLYDWDIREAVVFRDSDGLGDFQVFAADCSIAADFNRDGGRRSALSCIPDSDCGGDSFPAFEIRKRERRLTKMSDAFLSRGFGRKVFLLKSICGILTDKYVIVKKRRGSAVHEKQSEDFH